MREQVYIEPGSPVWRTLLVGVLEEQTGNFRKHVWRSAAVSSFLVEEEAFRRVENSAGDGQHLVMARA
jgi:hypothetical protein